MYNHNESCAFLPVGNGVEKSFKVVVHNILLLGILLVMSLVRGMEMTEYKSPNNNKIRAAWWSYVPDEESSKNKKKLIIIKQPEYKILANRRLFDVPNRPTFSDGILRIIEEYASDEESFSASARRCCLRTIHIPRKLHVCKEVKYDNDTFCIIGSTAIYDPFGEYALIVDTKIFLDIHDGSVIKEGLPITLNEPEEEKFDGNDDAREFARNYATESAKVRLSLRMTPTNSFNRDVCVAIEPTMKVIMPLCSLEQLHLFLSVYNRSKDPKRAWLSRNEQALIKNLPKKLQEGDMLKAFVKRSKSSKVCVTM